MSLSRSMLHAVARLLAPHEREAVLGDLEELQVQGETLPARRSSSVDEMRACFRQLTINGREKPTSRGGLHGRDACVRSAG